MMRQGAASGDGSFGGGPESATSSVRESSRVVQAARTNTAPIVRSMPYPQSGTYHRGEGMVCSEKTFSVRCDFSRAS